MRAISVARTAAIALIALTLAMSACSDAGRPGTSTSAVPNETEAQVETAPVARPDIGSGESSVPDEGDDIEYPVVHEGDPGVLTVPYDGPTLYGVTRIADNSVADGGALIRGTVVGADGEPALVTVRIDETLVGTEIAGEFTVGWWVGDTVSADDVEVGGEAIAVVGRSAAEVIAVALPDAGGGYIDRGLNNIYMLGPALNAEPSRAIPVRCGGAGQDASDSLTGMVAYLSSRRDRLSFETQEGLGDRAAMLAEERSATDELTGRTVAIDHLDLQRQLEAGVADDALVYRPTMRIVIRPSEASATSDYVFFVDGSTGNLLGWLGPDPLERTALVGIPTEGSTLDIYVAPLPQLGCATAVDGLVRGLEAQRVEPRVRIVSSWLDDRRVDVDLATGTVRDQGT